MSNSLNSSTDGGTNNWYYPVVPTKPSSKNYLTGPDGNGLTGNNNYPMPYKQPCGCNDNQSQRPPMPRPAVSPMPGNGNSRNLYNNNNYPPPPAK